MYTLSVYTNIFVYIFYTDGGGAWLKRSLSREGKWYSGRRMWVASGLFYLSMVEMITFENRFTLIKKPILTDLSFHTNGIVSKQ